MNAYTLHCLVHCEKQGLGLRPPHSKRCQHKGSTRILGLPPYTTTTYRAPVPPNLSRNLQVWPPECQPLSRDLKDRMRYHVYVECKPEVVAAKHGQWMNMEPE